MLYLHCAKRLHMENITITSLPRRQVPKATNGAGAVQAAPRFNQKKTMENP